MLTVFGNFVRAHLFAFSSGIPALALGLIYGLFIAGQLNFEPFDLIALCATASLGFMLGALVIYPIVWRLLQAHLTKLNQAIELNSSVQILCGPHRNKIARVYEVWESRGQARVDLGRESQQMASDVFMDYQ